MRERVNELGAQTHLGAGNKEADPATTENPPSDLRAGDKEHTQDLNLIDL